MSISPGKQYGKDMDSGVPCLESPLAYGIVLLNRLSQTWMMESNTGFTPMFHGQISNINVSLSSAFPKRFCTCDMQACNYSLFLLWGLERNASVFGWLSIGASPRSQIVFRPVRLAWCYDQQPKAYT